MNAELIQVWAAVINALALPVVILIIVVILSGILESAIAKGGGFRLKVQDVEMELPPAQGIRPPSGGPWGIVPNPKMWNKHRRPQRRSSLLIIIF